MTTAAVDVDLRLRQPVRPTRRHDEKLRHLGDRLGEVVTDAMLEIVASSIEDERLGRFMRPAGRGR